MVRSADSSHTPLQSHDSDVIHAHMFTRPHSAKILFGLYELPSFVNTACFTLAHCAQYDTVSLSAVMNIRLESGVFLKFVLTVSALYE